MGKKYYLDDAWDDKQASGLFAAVLKLKTSDDCNKFLGDLLTIKELKELTRRLKVAELLLKGLTYEAIKKEIGVHSTTINRVSIKLKHGRGGYKLIFDRLTKN